MEPGNQGGPQTDHQAAHPQGAQQAPKQDPVLKRGGDAEPVEDEGDDEDVIHGEGKLNEIAGVELERFLLAAPRLEGQPKEHGQTDPQGRPRQRLPHLDHAGAVVEHAQIEAQEHQHTDHETDPVPPGNVNHREHILLRAHSPGGTRRRRVSTPDDVPSSLASSASVIEGN